MSRNPFEAGLNKARQDASFKAAQDSKKERSVKDIMAEIPEEKPEQRPLRPESFEAKPAARETKAEKAEKLQTVLEAAAEQIRAAEGPKQVTRAILDFVELQGLPSDIDPKQLGDTGKRELAGRMLVDKKMTAVINRIAKDAKDKMPSTDDLNEISVFIAKTLRT